jgi:hypothetical protein
MTDQVDFDFAGDDDARAAVGAAVRYLLRDSAGSARADNVRELVEFVRDIASGLVPPQDPNFPDARAVKQPAMSGITYKAYVIDAFRRDTDRWRSTIRRLDGKKIRVAVPPSVVAETTTSADALTAEKAVEFAKKAIDGGELI